MGDAVFSQLIVAGLRSTWKEHENARKAPSSCNMYHVRNMLLLPGQWLEDQKKKKKYARRFAECWLRSESAWSETPLGFVEKAEDGHFRAGRRKESKHSLRKSLFFCLEECKHTTSFSVYKKSSRVCPHSACRACTALWVPVLRWSPSPGWPPSLAWLPVEARATWKLELPWWMTTEPVHQLGDKSGANVIPSRQ